MNAFFAIWLDELKANKRKPSSIEAVESIFFTHIGPFVGPNASSRFPTA